MSLKKHSRNLLKLSALLCVNAWGFDNVDFPMDQQTASIKYYPMDSQSFKVFDGFTFTPTLNVGERFDDNYHQAEHNTKSSMITNVTPTFVLASNNGKSAYDLSYQANTDFFHSAPSENNTDHDIHGDAAYEFDARNRVRFDLGWKKETDTAGQQQHTESDKYTDAHAGTMYTYGARTARGQIEFAGDYDQLRYQNSNGLNDSLERNTTAVRSTFYVGIAPKTRALIEARYADFSYLSDTDLDSHNIALLGGLAWDLTSRTTGTIKIGEERKTFEHAEVKQATGSLWEVGADYRPTQFSSFTVKARSAIDEGSDGASSIKTTSGQIGWDHEWLERLRTNVNYSKSDEQYQDIDRDDKLKGYGASVTYRARRWLDLGLSYTHAEDSSTAADESYIRNIYAINVTASL